MPQAQEDAEIQALQLVIQALEPLDDDARQRVLDYTTKRLGIRSISAVSALAELPMEPSASNEPKSARSAPPTVVDIRSLRGEKQPSSAIEMAALVAYYLAEAAPGEERTQEVTQIDIEKYFKQANYRLPSRIAMTLPNATAAGYFDRTATGVYRLNPVGFNLVTQSLPREKGASPTRARIGKRAAPAKKASPGKSSTK